jgi:PEP-CTERM motif
MSNVRAKRLIVAALFGVFLLAPAHARAAPILLNSFSDVANLAASGWTTVNNSTPGGTTGWFQGNAGVFPAEDGTDGYIAANFLNAALGGDISNWLLTPMLTVNDGDTLSFLTRANGEFADRLELRFSANGNSANVGSTTTSVGDFTTLLLTLNPTLTPVGYPTDWTLYTVTLSGLLGPTDGRFAFRYNVTDTLTNGDYIGIDDVTLNPVPEPATLTLLGIGLAGLGARRYRQRKADV